MTKTELIAAREAAGAAYAAAAKAYVDAYIELHAYDLTCGNGNVVALTHVLGFGEIAQVLQHGEFLRDVTTINGRAAERANDKHVAILATIAD
ncbi:hypothetical protein A6V36_24260 [Paraburkholderia ginsengiterrae]|uniref:Uncharacterized protein n=2 Tax=Paraburkholderia ginsengiterrae TaxID=1462993 RepID=A0A1A9NAC5_9BURK|nr:hypothetical protein A6V36_24260 [Paraburkholderia ginsengiterrae]OAJ62893.1 hypothetical protein A6V37_22040 [Paraburkholderia ginsengiterrae]